MEPLLVGIRDACGLLSIGKTKIFQMLAEQTLQRKKIGRKTLVTLESIRAIAGATKALPDHGTEATNHVQADERR